MPKQLTFAFVLFLLITGTAWAQCPPGTVSIVADRDNTLYQDATGMLSNGAGTKLFVGRTDQGSAVSSVGRTGQGSVDIRRGLIHFDVATNVAAGSTIATASLRLRLDQPRDNGTYMVTLHDVLADWGEGASLAGGGQGSGGPAMMNDATWLNTFFSTGTWSTPGGDFTPAATAATVVDAGVEIDYIWMSLNMAVDSQDWLDNPSTNFGWMLRGDENNNTTALRFDSRENKSFEPTLCLEVCPGLSDCTVFADGFESGDTTAWSTQSP